MLYRLCLLLSEAHTFLCAIVLDPLREHDRTHRTWALRKIPLGSGWIYAPSRLFDNHSAHDPESAHSSSALAER